MWTSLGSILLGVLAYEVFLTGGPLSPHAIPGSLLAVAEATSATVSVEGELVCLPRRDGPQTMECVFGLRGTDGRHYGLRNLDPELLATGKIVLGQQVLVTGLLTPEPMEPYDTAGTIEVDAVVQLNRRFNRRENIPFMQLYSCDLINAELWNPPG